MIIDAYVKGKYLRHVIFGMEFFNRRETYLPQRRVDY